MGPEDTLELLLESLIPPNSEEGEIGEHKGIRDETGIQHGETGDLPGWIDDENSQKD